MALAMLSTEVIISIIFGILQLIVGLISLWQQRHLRWTTGKLSSLPGNY